MNLYVYSYNNYYNRQVKKAGDSLADYQNFLHYGPIQGVQGFTPGDGVNTTQLLGSMPNMYDGKGDYFIAADEFGNIDSRWFIIDVNRTRNGQWALTLHRDLVVDYYEEIIESPMFIEKATLSPNSPLIFNSENMTVNQIKTSETLLKDKSGCPWIVGYYAKNIDNEYLSSTVNRNVLEDSYDILIDEPFATWKFNATKNNFLLTPTTAIEYRIYGKNPTYSGSVGYIAFNDIIGYAYEEVGSQYATSSQLNFNGRGTVIGYAIENTLLAQKDKLYSELVIGDYANITSQQDSEFFLNLNNVIIKDSLGAFYQINIESVGKVSKVYDIPAGALYESLSQIVLSNSTVSGGTNSHTFKVKTECAAYKMIATELVGLETTWDMTNSKLTTEDAPYNIFAIPLGETTLKLNTGDTLANSNKEDSIAIVSSIIQKMSPATGGGYLYDIQLLPYCPLTIEEEGIITVNSNLGYSPVMAPENVVIGYILNISRARFTKNIYLNNPINITNAKIENECDVYKLCSPNWASEFQFNAAKNGGVEYFNIDCEYKPYQPYIHVNPNFGELYGRDFDDARGLILSGDFSLSQISDAWQNYQIQNKNFQNIFDRQVQNMELTQNIQRTQEKWRIGAASLTGAATGVIAGGQIGGPLGGVVGGVVGGVASVAGGIADYNMNEQLRTEALDYTKDMFGYQLGNIQALPYTLTKVSSYNNNNKIFPVLEYYTCTDVEKEAVANKIAWNGMSVGVIGKMADYINNDWSYNDIKSKGYIKGQLIRLELPINHEENKHNEDFQILKAISNELLKGVYIKWE